MKDARTTVEIDASGLHYRRLNEEIRRAAAGGAERIVLRNVLGQRYIGAGLTSRVRFEIHGVPGNDLACFMDGPEIEVFENVQDGVANTMGGGRVVVHGDAGDVIGYSMRGGKLFIRGDAGYRVGIHMKAYGEKSPVIVVGGTVKDYVGEYMAGGTLVVLGLGREGERVVGELAGTGMHGGELFVRGGMEPESLGREVGRREIDDAVWERLRGHLEEFCGAFGLEPGRFDREEFARLVPVSRRPYGRIYVY